jgi:hypothetical protein
MSEPVDAGRRRSGYRWRGWYGWGARPLAEAWALLAEALGPTLVPHEEFANLGGGYFGERPEGLRVWVTRKSPPHDAWIRPEPEYLAHQTRIMIHGYGGFEERDEVDRVLFQLPGLTRLPLRRPRTDPYRRSCYGWGQTPLVEAAAILGAALGLDFRTHEGLHLGVHYDAKFPSGEVSVRDNYECDYPHEPGEEGPRMESAYPDHRTLVYVWAKGEAAIAWWAEREPTPAGLAGLVRLWWEEWRPETADA